MGSYTDVYNLYKPTVGERGWGTAVDNNFDFIEEALVDLGTRVTTLEDGTGGGHVIQQAGTPLTQRTALNFLYNEVTDDLADDATVVGAATGYWAPLTNMDPDSPELVFAEGDVVMVFVEG